MIQVIHRALDILEYIANDSNKPKLLIEISNELKLKPSTCANIIKTLLEREYLQKSINQKGYELGKRVYYLTDKNSNQKKLIEASDAELLKLTSTLNENTLIAIMDSDNRVVINKKLSNQIVQAQTPDKKNAYDSSTGRLMIAFFSDEEIKTHINKYGLPTKKVWSGINSEKQFQEQVNIIRQNGYVLLEDSVQIVGFAAPIKLKEKVIASLSIYIPAFRYNDEIRNKFINLGLSTAEKISNNLK